jgi:hypothetical protein
MAASLHVFILSTMSADLTKLALDIELDPQPGTIQSFAWDKHTTLWIACQHPVVCCLAESILPYMDHCVCWYHDQCALSCLRVHACMTFLEKYNHNISLMTTTRPCGVAHESRIRKYFNHHGFVRKCYNQEFQDNVRSLLAT